MALTFREILSWCEENHKEFWEYMLYDDMHIREVSAEESMHKTAGFDAWYGRNIQKRNNNFQNEIIN